MDVQLQELIDKIKKDGVAAAENSASERLAAAEKEAAKIISDAKEEADKIIRQAKDETVRMERASEDAIAQASRNLVLSFRKSVENEFSALVSAETAKVYDAKLLANLIPETVREWAKRSDVSELSVLLSEKDLQELEMTLRAALKDEIAKGLTLKISTSLSGGFRIGVKDGAAYYDYSAEAVADLFAAYLNPRTAAIMKEAAKA